MKLLSEWERWGDGCAQKLWMPHLGKCSGPHKMRFGAALPSGNCSFLWLNFKAVLFLFLFLIVS